MPRKPNFSFERSQRDKAKAEKKAAKLEAKAAKRQDSDPDADAPDGAVEPETGSRETN